MLLCNKAIMHGKRNLGGGSAELARVRKDDRLVHVKMQGSDHVVECLNILVECRDEENVGAVTEIGHKIEVSRVVADCRCQASPRRCANRQFDQGQMWPVWLDAHFPLELHRMLFTLPDVLDAPPITGGLGAHKPKSLVHWRTKPR